LTSIGRIEKSPGEHAALDPVRVELTRRWPLGIHPREAWAYIKARRRQLRPKKFERRQTSASRNFLCRKQAESVFPLECGTIEAYLPEG